MTQTKNKDFLDEIIDKIDFKGLTQDELGIKVRLPVFNDVSLPKVNRVIDTLLPNVVFLLIRYLIFH